MTTNGYIRQSAGTIVTSNTIQASDFNNEYNALQTAFDSSVGHAHDGTTGGGQKLAPAALNALTTNGIVARTSATTFAGRTITGTANQITVSNGDGVSGNPTLSLPTALTFTGFTITGGTYAAVTALGIRSSGAAFDLQVASSEVLTASRTLSIIMGDAARTLTFAGNATISGTNTGDQTTISGNANSATLVATTATTTNASFFPLFVASSTNSNQAASLDTTLTYNPSTDTLACANIAGNASTASTAAKWTTPRNLAGNSVDGSATVAFANKFIVQGTTDAGLSAAQFLGALGTGVVKNTTSTGILSIAVAETDYVTPTGAGTLTNKTLTSPIISTISNTGTLTLPTSTDTLVGRATTDTLTNKTLTSPSVSNLTLQAGTTALAPLVFTAGSNSTTAIAGAVEYDGIRFEGTPLSTQRGVIRANQQLVVLTASAGSNSASAQTFFGVGVTLTSSTVYEFEANYYMSKSVGTTAHTVGLLFGGTATLNSIGYSTLTTSSTTGFSGINTCSEALAQAATAFVVTASSASASLFQMIKIRGYINVNSGGTFIPQYITSAAPGGVYTLAIGTDFKIGPIGVSGSSVIIGNWA